MPAALPLCACPRDSTVQLLFKIASNYNLIFKTMSAGAWVGKLPTTLESGCGCSEAEILRAMAWNSASFFNWLSENGVSDVASGIADLDTNDASKAITFPAGMFAIDPVVVGNLVSPDGLGVMDANPDDSTLTTAGVTFVFGGLVPGVGWKLHWFAKEPG